eukprot:4375212-Amphidinium_carterae.2
MATNAVQNAGQQRLFFTCSLKLSDAKAPPWWRPGTGIKENMKEGSAVAAAGHALVQDEPVIVLDQEQVVLDQEQVETEEPDKKRRKKTVVAKPLPIWLLLLMRHMKSAKQWSRRKTFAIVQKMVPDVFGEPSCLVEALGRGQKHCDQEDSWSQKPTFELGDVKRLGACFPFGCRPEVPKHNGHCLP